MAAGLATFREVLTRESYAHVGELSKKLTEGYRAIVKKSGLQAYVVSAGANGALMLYPKEIQNYRDWTKIDVDLWRHYWFAMINRGVLPQLIGGTSSGPSPFSISARTSTSILPCLKKLPPRLPRRSKSEAWHLSVRPDTSPFPYVT